MSKVRRLIVLGLIIPLVLPLAVYAASIGGAETQGQGKFSVGLDQSFMFDRDLEDMPVDFSEGTIEVSGKMSSKIDKMNRTMVKTSYGLLDNLDVYVKLGNAKPEGSGSYSGTWVDGVHTGTCDGTSDIDGDNAFAYAAGFKVNSKLGNGWLVGLDAQYLRHKNDYDASKTIHAYDDLGALVDTRTGSWTGELTLDEWHVAPYVAKKVGNFTTYLGVKYSDMKIDFESEGDDEKLELDADDNVGVFVGASYKLKEAWSFNIEGRFVDETAMSFAVTYRF